MALNVPPIKKNVTANILPFYIRAKYKLYFSLMLF